MCLKHAHVPILLIECGAQWGIRTRNQCVLSAPSLPIGLIGHKVIRHSDNAVARYDTFISPVIIGGIWVYLESL
jgi:hypothetical protein